MLSDFSSSDSWPRKMSLAFWTAVLSVLSPVLSVSIGTWQGQISSSSFNDHAPLEIVPHVSMPLPWIIGGSDQALPPLSSEFNQTTLSSRLNLTLLSRRNVNYECDDHLNSLLPTECREAWRQIPRFDGKLYSIGNRSAEQKWDIPLPMRWPSSKWTSQAQRMKLLIHQSVI